jgi:Holliday junction resolvase RusA-like endonuclease
MKAARDGMAEALMAGEDAGLTTLPITRGIDKENPRVEITIAIATESS